MTSSYFAGMYTDPITCWPTLIARGLVYIESIPTRDAAVDLLRQADEPGAPAAPKWRAALEALVAAYDRGASRDKAGAWVPRRTLRRADGSRIVDAEGRPVSITLALPRGPVPARWWVGEWTPHPADDASALRRAGYIAVPAPGYDRVQLVSPRGVHATHRT
jgi:hypothetical protein